MDYFCSGEFTYSSASSPSSSSPPGVVSYNGKLPVSGVFENSSSSAAVSFQPNLHGVSMDWTPEEQAILEEGLVEFASETSIVRYAKIAMHLDNKTIRDVALRCRWLTSHIQKKDVSKRRKEDTNLTRKSKDRKEKIPDPSVMNSQAMQSAFPPYQMLSSDIGLTYNDTDATWLLIRQNKETLDMISTNIATRQVHQNVGLLWQARENISNILSNLRDPPTIPNRLPDFTVKMNEEPTNSVLPASVLLMH